MAFNNPITGGGGTLVIDRIKSDNFVPDVSGWDIEKNGDAFFNNITAKGSVTTNLVIVDNNGGIFIYAIQ